MALSPRSAPPSTTPSGSEVRAGLGSEAALWEEVLGEDGGREQTDGGGSPRVQRGESGWGQEFLSRCRYSSIPFLVLPPSEPHFVHALEHGDHVYFFFREVSVEDARLGRVRRRWWAPGMGRRRALLDPAKAVMSQGRAPDPNHNPRH